MFLYYFISISLLLLNAIGARADDLTNFEADYIIKSRPDVKSQEVAQFDQGEEITVLHTVTNNEEDDLSIIGLGGTLIDPSTGEVAVNLSANSVGPIIIHSGELTSVGQKMALNIVPGNYALSPQIYVAFKDEIKAIQARKQLAIVKEVPVSLTSPHLLFLELLFVITLVFVVKLGFPTQKRSTVSNGKKAARASSSGIDESWLPPIHQQLGKKRRTKRKNY